jgi:thiamine pyrophosphokinase
LTAVIVSNGSVKDDSCYRKYFDQADLIICADGGAKHLRRFGVKPHVLLGDLDSITQEDLKYFQDAGVHIERYPAEKDMTDTELAVEYAAAKGCRELILIGSLGTRMDHSLSNIFMLKHMLDKGIQGRVVNEKNEIVLIRDRILLSREEDTRITLLPLSERVEGVTTRGLYYPLDNATLEMGSTWAVSNEFAADTAEVTIRSGLLLVMKARD